ncbi:MurR/RpiR family transcriptional regulator [Bacillus sp. 1P06AnD]|uniref:MurR/RpiR family transcriptional regulator n=1 Tax=Bacillus sp. 1P06AnD TaxID=3132208 RepID=UPI0039A333A2
MYVMDVLLRIESMLAQLPKSEQKVAQYVLENPMEVIRMTVNDLAQQAHASSSAVIRFCRSIEIDSFTELKVSISSQLSQAETEKKGFYDIEPNEEIKEIKEKIVSNSVRVLQETSTYLDEHTLNDVVEAMKNADVIYVYGLGASWLVVEDIVHKWLRLGKMVTANQDAHITASALAASRNNSVFFTISNSGNTEEVLRLVDIAQHAGVRTIGLSRFGHNKLSEKVDMSLQHVRAPEAKYRSAATSSLFAQFLTIDIIFYAYVSKYYSEYITGIQRSREAVLKYKEGILDH